MNIGTKSYNKVAMDMFFKKWAQYEPSVNYHQETSSLFHAIASCLDRQVRAALILSDLFEMAFLRLPALIKSKI